MKLRDLLTEKRSLGLGTVRKPQSVATHRSNHPGRDKNKPKNYKVKPTPKKHDRVMKTGNPVGRPKGSGKGGVKAKKRPNKNLRFSSRAAWAADLQWEIGEDNLKKYETNRGEVIATNLDGTMCYGYWDDANQSGITYYKPYPLYAVIHPKRRLR